MKNCVVAYHVSNSSVYALEMCVGSIRYRIVSLILSICLLL